MINGINKELGKKIEEVIEGGDKFYISGLCQILNDKAKNKYFFADKYNIFMDDIKSSVDESKINNTLIIQVEIDNQGIFDTQFRGLNIALYILRKYPKTKVILASILDEDIIQKVTQNYGNLVKNSFSEILTYPNCRFYKISPFAENYNDINLVFDSQNQHEYNNEIANSKNEYFISELIHDIKYGGFDLSKNYTENQIEIVIDQIKEGDSRYKPLHNTISKCLEYYPSMKNKTNTQIVNWILSTKLDIPEVAKGQFFSGVYVDADGTLFERVTKGSDAEGLQIINQDLLSHLQELEKQGKEIYIFTGGNLKEKQKLLDNYNIKRKLVSKHDMTGGTAEIVYDDTGDQETFFAETKILAKIYNNVKRFIRSDN